MLRIHLTLLFCFSCQFALAGEWVETKSDKGTTTTIKWRILLVKKRMYQIGCVGVGKRVSNEMVDKIRASFKLLK